MDPFNQILALLGFIAVSALVNLGLLLFLLGALKK